MPTPACLVVVGNLVRQASALAVSSAASGALADPEALRDGRTDLAFRFADPPGALEHVTITARRLTNGGFDSWAGLVAPGWTFDTSAGGHVERETFVVYSGPSAVALVKDSAGDTALARQAVLVSPGSRWRASWALRGSGTMPAVLRILNTRTGNSLAPDGSWSAQATLAAQVQGHYTPGSLDFSVEPFASCGADPCELVVEVHAGAGTGRAYADALDLVPVADVCSVHGHNLTRGSTVELVGSDDGFVTETVVTAFEPYTPAFYRRFAPAAFAQWRLRFTGAGPETIWMGEWVLGASLPLRLVQQGMKLRAAERQVRHETPAGTRVVYNRTVCAAREVDLSWQLLSPEALAQHTAEVFARGRGGRDALVLVPWLDLDTLGSPPAAERAVLLGHVHDTTEATWAGPREYRVSATVEEAAFPAVDELLG